MLLAPFVVSLWLWSSGWGAALLGRLLPGRDGRSRVPGGGAVGAAFGLVGLAAAGLWLLVPWNRVARLPGFLAVALSTYAYLAATLIVGRVVVLNGRTR